MLDQYAVIGNPVTHSLSPLIHKNFALQTKQKLVYKSILSPLDGFVECVKDFLSRNGHGLNVTAPFKQQAYQFAQIVTAKAEEAKSVNTLLYYKNNIYGDNTDGVGLIRDFARQNITITSKKILILGAGGAAKGIIAPILAQSPNLLIIANRSADKAFSLVRHFSHLGEIMACNFRNIKPYFDLIINTTSAYFNSEITIPHACVDGAYCYDLFYNTKRLTSFLEWSQKNYAIHTSDGLGMLVEQAAESFYVWRGIYPDVSIVSDLLRGKG